VSFRIIGVQGLLVRSFKGPKNLFDLDDFSNHKGSNYIIPTVQLCRESPSLS